MSVATASAQTPATGATAGSYRGEIVTGGEAPIVNVNGQDRPLVVAPNATIMRGNVTVRPADLKKGDVVTVTTSPDGSATRIEAIPADENSGGFKWWYLLPLLLLPLLFLFRRKKKDTFIVEPNRDATPERTTTTTTERTTDRR